MAVNYSRHLNDGLVGKDESGDIGKRVKRLPLTAGAWAFVFSDGDVYVGEGTWFHVTSCYGHHEFPVADDPSPSLNIVLQGSRRRESTCLARVNDLNWCNLVPCRSCI